jgi:hypothetical protein
VWTVLYIAPTIEIAYRLRDRIAEEGYEVRLRTLALDQRAQVEISARSTELQEVQDLLMQIIHEQ